MFELQDFTNWLQDGTGIFWISGKPGSGKSTLMKFITQSNKTWDLVHNFQRGAHEISASFFFHFRGSVMQKSFEGVLRSIVKQFIEQYPPLFEALQPVIPRGIQFKLPEWTVPGLERLLTAILEQKIFEVDVCLFFDALDEFDGHHTLICNFLKRLVSTHPTSSTRVKVCFSSRPWEIFEANFARCPGFRIQDHTEADISDYCSSSLSQVAGDVPFVEELVPEIVTRAAGVFLWVKLVLGQLARGQASEPRVPLTLADMRATIEALPTELDEFYEVIVQRIPRSLRWQTYALLETLVRSSSDESSGASFVILTVFLSDCRTYTQGVTRPRPKADPDSQEKLIAKWSGGLAEIVRVAAGDPEVRIQLMHQTVHDFATSLKFKERVLGELNAKITHENGHTFLAKGRLLQCRWDPDRHQDQVDLLTHHLLEAEASTGRSLFGFLSDATSASFDMLRSALGAPQAAMSWPGVASALGLRLFLVDFAAKFPSSLPSSTERLLECTLKGTNKAKYETAAVLLELGFPPHERADTLWPALWAGRPRPRPLGYTEPDAFRDLGILEHDLTVLLVQRGWDPRQDIFGRASGLVGYRSHDSFRYSLLHLALPELTVFLLARGVDPSIQDDRGRTPLDWILDDRAVLVRGWHIEKARLLVDANGTLARVEGISSLVAAKFLSPMQLDAWTAKGWVMPPGKVPPRSLEAPPDRSQEVSRGRSLLHRLKNKVAGNYD